MASPQIIPLHIGSPDVWNYVATGPRIDQAATGGPRELFVAANNCLRMEKVVPPGNYAAAGSLVLKLVYTMATVITGTTVWGCEIDSKTSAVDDFNVNDYDAVNTSGADTVSGDVDIPHTVAITLANRDGMALGDEVRVRLGPTAAGSATGDIQLRDAWLEFTPA